MIIKFNFSPGAKISWRLVQKWPRYKKKTQKWTLKNVFFFKNPPGFWTFKTSSSNLTSNQPFGLEPINWDINFVLKCLPGHCDHQLQKYLNPLKANLQNSDYIKQQMRLLLTDCKYDYFSLIASQDHISPTFSLPHSKNIWSSDSESTLEASCKSPT